METSKTKQCTKCNQERAINEFVKDRNREDGYQSCCKPCKNLHYLSKKGGKLCDPKERHQRAQRTLIKKYGVTNPSQLPKVKALKKLNSREKYGVDHPMQTTEICNKVKSTNLQRYGVDNPRKVEEFKEKAKQTLQERYGVSGVLQVPGFKQKAEGTLLKNYGVTNPTKSLVIKEKIKQTCINRYGKPHPRQSKEVINRLKEKNLLGNKILTVTLEGKLISLVDLCERFDRSYSRALIIYKNHGETRLLEWIKDVKKSQRSFYEDYILNYINSLGNFEIHTNTRAVINPKELDIYLPNFKLGIEVHGHYYHSDKFVERNYHKEKLDLAESKGISLMQMYDIDIDSKPDIIKSLIKNRLGLSQKIYARKCQVTNLDVKTYKTFLEANHAQGYAAAPDRLGLTFQGELVAVMSFSPTRFSKNHQTELVRFCVKSGNSVVGGSNKLFNYYIRNHEQVSSIISFCDRDLFDGSMYPSLGFTLKSINPPSYFYVKGGKKLNRLKFQKHKLPNILDNFDIKLTEKQNMKNNGYYVIYTSGQKVYTWCRTIV